VEKHNILCRRARIFIIAHVHILPFFLNFLLPAMIFSQYLKKQQQRQLLSLEKQFVTANM